MVRKIERIDRTQNLVPPFKQIEETEEKIETPLKKMRQNLQPSSDA
jgi:hypothetical protein